MAKPAFSAAHGYALPSFGEGMSITFDGVAAGDLGAEDFLLGALPVTNNSGNMVLSNGAVLAPDLVAATATSGDEGSRPRGPLTSRQCDSTQPVLWCVAGN